MFVYVNVTAFLMDKGQGSIWGEPSEMLLDYLRPVDPVVQN